MKHFQILINQVLNNELNGRYILRNGTIIFSSNTSRNKDLLPKIFPYKIGKECYTADGKIAINEENNLDIVGFQRLDTGELWEYEPSIKYLTVDELIKTIEKYPSQTKIFANDIKDMMFLDYDEENEE